MSVGLNPEDAPVGTPYRIPWAEHLPSLKELGLPLEASQLPAIEPSGPPEVFRHS
jgi:hypothetical protein